jgi:hypothetical protein
MEVSVTQVGTSHLYTLYSKGSLRARKARRGAETIALDYRLDTGPRPGRAGAGMDERAARSTARRLRTSGEQRTQRCCDSSLYSTNIVEHERLTSGEYTQDRAIGIAQSGSPTICEHCTSAFKESSDSSRESVRTTKLA